MDTWSHTNRLRSWSPLWKSTFALILFIIAYVGHPLVQWSLFFWLAVWVVGYAGIAWQTYVKLLCISCLFFAASLPALLIEFTAKPVDSALFQMTINGWTMALPAARLMTVWLLFSRVASCLACMFFIVLTTPLPELLQVLKKLKMPLLVLELMQVMYRFLFLLSDTAEQMIRAQLARGGRYGFKRMLHDTARLVVRLFTKTMERYTGLSYGLAARGFVDELRLPPYVPRPVPLRYRCEGLVGISVCVAMEIALRWEVWG